MVVFVSWNIYKTDRNNLHEGWPAALGSGILASQVALIVHGMTDAVTWGMVRPAPIVWAIWGLAIAGWNVYASNQVKKCA